MDVKEIIHQYLTANGYEGLAGDECGCSIDDLHPCCDSCFCGCKPAYRCKQGKCVMHLEWECEIYCTKKPSECEEAAMGEEDV